MNYINKDVAIFKKIFGKDYEKIQTMVVKMEMQVDTLDEDRKLIGQYYDFLGNMTA